MTVLELVKAIKAEQESVDEVAMKNNLPLETPVTIKNRQHLCKILDALLEAESVLSRIPGGSFNNEKDVLDLDDWFEKYTETEIQTEKGNGK